jgi:cyanate permease
MVDTLQRQGLLQRGSSVGLHVIEAPFATEDRHDWSMLALSWLMYFAFSFTLASLFPVVGSVRTDLDLSYAQIGIILGGWQLVYLAAAIPVGILVDRFQPKLVLFAGALLVASSLLGRSLAHDFITLWLAVALLGLGGPAMSVGLPKVIAECFAGRPRVLASGIYVTGAHVGQMTALAATSIVMLALGDSWRITFRIYAGVVVLIAMTWLIWAKPIHRSPTSSSRPGALAGLRHVARLRSVWLIVAVGFAGFLGSHGYRSWLPEMLTDKGISPASAGLLAAVPAFCGMVGSIIIVRFGTGRHRKKTIIALLAVVGTGILVSAWATGSLLFMAIAIEGFCAGALMPMMVNTLMNMPQVGARYMGAAASLYFTIGEIGGFAGPSIVGLLVGLTGSFKTGMLVLSLIMWIMIVPASRLPLAKGDGPWR